MKDCKSIYLYHLDYEIQTLFALNKTYSRETIYNAFMMVTKMAILLCEDSIIMPASNYFESDFAFSMLNEMNDSNFDSPEFLKLVSSSFNFNEIIEKKKIQHGEYFENYHYVDFVIPEKKVYLPGTLIKRKNSASLDIKKVWMSEEGQNRLVDMITKKYPNEFNSEKLGEIIYDVPNKLGGRAYISRYITPFFKPSEGNMYGMDNVINCFITKEYIRSFLDEYKAACLIDIPLVDASAVVPNEEGYTCISYKKYVTRLKKAKYKGKNALNYIRECNLEGLFEFKESDTWKFVSDEKYNDERIYISKQNDDKRNDRKGVIMNNKVFVVHGHDKIAKLEVELALKNAGLEPIVLSEQPNQGLTIIEKIEENTDVSYAVILYTPCDMGREKEEDPEKERPRARQNVVLEHGYLMGKLKRQRVSALVKGNVEVPSDISGIMYINMDDSGWKAELAKNMQAAGLDFDFAKFCI